MNKYDKNMDHNEILSKYTRLMKYSCDRFRADEEYVTNVQRILRRISRLPPHRIVDAIYGTNIYSRTIHKNFYTLFKEYCLKHIDDDGMMKIIDAVDDYIKEEHPGFKDEILKEEHS